MHSIEQKYLEFLKNKNPQKFKKLIGPWEVLEMISTFSQIIHSTQDQFSNNYSSFYNEITELNQKIPSHDSQENLIMKIHKHPQDFHELLLKVIHKNHNYLDCHQGVMYFEQSQRNKRLDSGNYYDNPEFSTRGTSAPHQEHKGFSSKNEIPKDRADQFFSTGSTDEQHARSGSPGVSQKLKPNPPIHEKTSLSQISNFTGVANKLNSSSSAGNLYSEPNRIMPIGYSPGQIPQQIIIDPYPPQSQQPSQSHNTYQMYNQMNMSIKTDGYHPNPSTPNQMNTILSSSNSAPISSSANNISSSSYINSQHNPSSLNYPMMNKQLAHSTQEGMMLSNNGTNTSQGFGYGQYHNQHYDSYNQFNNNMQNSQNQPQQQQPQSHQHSQMFQNNMMPTYGNSYNQGQSYQNYYPYHMMSKQNMVMGNNSSNNMSGTGAIGHSGNSHLQGGNMLPDNTKH